MQKDQTTSLREIAVRLARFPISKSRDKIADVRLLSLLKTGELSAGFHFPGLVGSWIQIPVAYWLGVTGDKFRSIRYASGDKKRTGVFKVKISDFAQEYADLVLNASKSAAKSERNRDLTALFVEELRLAISAAAADYEVVILERDWEVYLQRNKLQEPPAHEKSKVGRHPKTSWRDLSIIIGAYLMKHCETEKGRLKIVEASKNIHKIATNDGIEDLPASDTIKDVLAKMKSMAETLSLYPK